METVELHSVSTELERLGVVKKGVEISVVNEQVASVILMQEKAFFQWR